MSQRLLVTASKSYTSQSALQAEMTTLHTATPVSVVVTFDQSQGAAWARAWAQQKGVQWLAIGAMLDAMGLLDPFARNYRAALLANADGVLAAGAAADPIVTHLTTVVRSGTTVTKI